MSSLDVSSALSTNSSTGASLGQGIDVATIVSQLVQAQSGPLTQMQNEQTTLETQQSALETISSQLQSLYNAVTALTDPAGQFSASDATSSNSSILTASAASGTPLASHTVVVNSLATTSSYYSDEFSSGTASIPQGSFTLQAGNGAPATVTIDSTDNTLNGLAAAINNQNLGVTATVINDSNGARLAIVSNTSGAPGNITISNNTTGINFTQATQGTNASLTVDGVPVSSSSNTVTNVIQGVTLNLASAAPNTPVTVSVAPDTTQAETAVNNFVGAYNTLIGSLNSQFQVDSSGNAGPLAGDSSVSLLQNQLLADVSYSMSGNNGVTNLASIGINMNDDGTLTVDNTTLENAIQTNFAAVQNFIQGTTGSFGSNLTNDLTTLTDPTQGIIAVDLNGNAQTQQDLSQQISDFQDQLNTLTQTLTQQYDQVNVVLQELPLLQAQTSSDLASL